VLLVLGAAVSHGVNCG